MRTAPGCTGAVRGLYGGAAGLYEGACPRPSRGLASLASSGLCGIARGGWGGGWRKCLAVGSWRAGRKRPAGSAGSAGPFPSAGRASSAARVGSRPPSRYLCFITLSPLFHVVSSSPCHLPFTGRPPNPAGEPRARVCGCPVIRPALSAECGPDRSRKRAAPRSAVGPGTRRCRASKNG